MEVYLLPRETARIPPQAPPQAMKRAPQPAHRVPTLAPPNAARSAEPLVQIPAPAQPAAGAAPQGKLDGNVARTWRRRMGCQQADVLGLTDAERDACLDALAAGSKTAPLYPVISPRKKQIFDGEYCPPDDDWCLYRMGKGPYPGLFGLGKFKSH